MRARQAHSSPSNNVGVALLALAILLPLVYLGFTKSIPFKPQYEIKAAFESSNNLKKGSPVRIAGVEVGKRHEGRARRARAARPSWSR